MSVNQLQSTALTLLWHITIFMCNFIIYSMTNTSGCCYSL